MTMREPPRPLTNDHGSPEPLTNNQGVPEPLIDNQGVPEPLTDKKGAPGPLTDNQGAIVPQADNQGSRARGPLIQIFINLYAKPVRNLRDFFLKLAAPCPRLTLL